MNETKLLIIWPGIMGRYQKTQLRKAGIEVIETSEPEHVRLIGADAELNSSELFWAAMQTLKNCSSSLDKSKFVDLVASLTERKTQ